MEKTAEVLNLADLIKTAAEKWYYRTRFASIRRVRREWNIVPKNYVNSDMAAAMVMSEGEIELYTTWRVYKNSYLETLEQVSHFKKMYYDTIGEIFKKFPASYSSIYIGVDVMSSADQAAYWKLRYEQAHALDYLNKWEHYSAIESDRIRNSKCPI